jgi:glycosyltransferase involved in cell wall biosynthesis
VGYDNHEYLRHLHGLVNQLVVGHAVHYLGHRADVPEILCALDISLLPSWQEPCGYVMPESLALGTPVHARDMLAIYERAAARRPAAAVAGAARSEERAEAPWPS